MSAAQILFVIGVLITGILVSAGGYLVYLRTKNTHNWPRTIGTILSSYVEVREHTSAKYDGVDSTSYDPFVNYQYEVNGKHYICSKIGYGGINLFGGRNAARRIVSKYPEGAKVTVYYEPHSPRDAVLEPGASTGAILVIIAGVILIIFGIFLVIGSLFSWYDFGMTNFSWYD